MEYALVEVQLRVPKTPIFYDLKDIGSDGTNLFYKNSKLDSKINPETLLQIVVLPIGAGKPDFGRVYKAKSIAPHFSTFSDEVRKELEIHKNEVHEYQNRGDFSKRLPKSAADRVNDIAREWLLSKGETELYSF